MIHPITTPQPIEPTKPTNLDRAKAFLDTLPDGSMYFLTTFQTVPGGIDPDNLDQHIDEIDEDLADALTDATITGVTVVILYDTQVQP